MSTPRVQDRVAVLSVISSTMTIPGGPGGPGQSEGHSPGRNGNPKHPPSSRDSPSILYYHMAKQKAHPAESGPVNSRVQTNLPHAKGAVVTPGSDLKQTPQLDTPETSRKNLIPECFTGRSQNRLGLYRVGLKWTDVAATSAIANKCPS